MSCHTDAGMCLTIRNDEDIFYKQNVEELKGQLEGLAAHARGVGAVCTQLWNNSV